VPSVQVIQPTPTKIKKTRRRSAGGASLNSFSSSEISHGSPKPRGVGQGRNSLGTNVDPAEHSPLANRSRPRAMVEEEDESEAERLKAVEEARKIRAREKGKERQRKKRERDRLAKDRLAREVRIPNSGEC